MGRQTGYTTVTAAVRARIVTNQENRALSLFSLSSTAALQFTPCGLARLPTANLATISFLSARNHPNATPMMEEEEEEAISFPMNVNSKRRQQGEGGGGGLAGLPDPDSKFFSHIF